MPAVADTEILEFDMVNRVRLVPLSQDSTSFNAGTTDLADSGQPGS